MNKLSLYNEKIDRYCDGRRLYTYLDIIWCMVRYGFSPNEYFKWTLYNFSGLKRKTFVNHRIEKKLFKENSKEIEMIFGDKARFMQEYKDFTKRDFVNLYKEDYESFERLVKKHGEVFIKALWACGGFGARTYAYKSDDDLKQYYAEISDDNKEYGLIAEELVKQHPQMYLVGDKSVNTIRVATYTYKDEVCILGCTLRMGGNKCTDNFSDGGTCAAVDIETGIVISDCYRDMDNHWIHHPYTNTVVPGFAIPHWDKVIDICKKAALYKPGAVYIGWDVVILEDDVALIEGNTNHGIFQNVDKVGKYKIHQRF